MKRTIFSIILTFFVTFGFCQTNHHFFKHRIDIRQYEVIDSLPIERIYISSQFDYDEDKIISVDDNQYLIEAPYKDKMIIKTNKDRTKAIVLYNSYIFGRHMQFNIKETDKRIVLWYEDENIMCGYAYDKRYKVCKYFEDFDKTKFEELRKRMFENMPRPPFYLQRR